MGQKKNLIVFKNEDFGRLRTVYRNGEYWFVAKDVCNALEYKNIRESLRKIVDAEDKGVTVSDTLGGKQKLTVINESGLYSLIFGSRLPNAKKFKRWVTSEVLPSIRKTGKYEITDNKAVKEEYITDTIKIFQVDLPLAYFPEKRFLYIALKPLNTFLEGNWGVVEDFVKNNKLSYDYLYFENGEKELGVLYQDYIRLVKAINVKNVPFGKWGDVKQLKRDIPKVLQGYILGIDKGFFGLDTAFSNTTKMISINSYT